MDGVGLCIKCNDFIECITDINVAPEEDDNGVPISPPGQNIGIGEDQGISNDPNEYYPYLAGGNTFSDGITNIHYINDPDYCSWIYYTHHYEASTDEKVISLKLYKEILRFLKMKMPIIQKKALAHLTFLVEEELIQW